MNRKLPKKSLKCGWNIYEKIQAWWICVGVDTWTSKIEIIASNGSLHIYTSETKIMTLKYILKIQVSIVS